MEGKLAKIQARQSQIDLLTAKLQEAKNVALESGVYPVDEKVAEIKVGAQIDRNLSLSFTVLELFLRICSLKPIKWCLLLKRGLKRQTGRQYL